MQMRSVTFFQFRRTTTCIHKLCWKDFVIFLFTMRSFLDQCLTNWVIESTTDTCLKCLISVHKISSLIWRAKLYYFRAIVREAWRTNLCDLALSKTTIQCRLESGRFELVVPIFYTNWAIEFTGIMEAIF